MLLGSSTASSEALVIRLCGRKRCGKPARDDSDLCNDCDEAEKARKRAVRKSHVDRCYAKWICVDCPAKSPRRAASYIGEKPAIALCHAHRIKRSKHKALGVARLVAKWRERKERAATAVSVDSDGRSRNHGRQKRGKPRNEDLTLADFDDAIKELVSARAAYAYSQSPEVLQRPRIQRDDAVKEAFAKGDIAFGFFVDAKIRHRLAPPRSDE